MAEVWRKVEVERPEASERENILAVNWAPHRLAKPSGRIELANRIRTTAATE
jgi:hypothetical protein